MVYKIQPEIVKSKTLRVSTLLQIHVRKNIFLWTWLCNFVIKLDHVKILDFIISVCILYKNNSRMIIFGLLVNEYHNFTPVRNLQLAITQIFIMPILTLGTCRDSKINIFECFIHCIFVFFLVLNQLQLHTFQTVNCLV